MALALVATLAPAAVAPVVAAGPALTPAVGGTALSADTALAPPGDAVYATLTGPVIQSAAAGDLVGTLTLAMPPGFALAAGVGGVTIAGSGCGDLALGAGPAVTASGMTLTTTGTTQDVPCSLTVSALQAAPTAGTPLAAGAVTASGIATGDAGDLAEVAGAAAALQFRVEPGASSQGGAVIDPGPQVLDLDRFGNARAGGLVTLGLQSPAGASLSCPANPATTDPDGLASFAGCAIDHAGAFALTAADGSAAATSTPVVVSVGAAIGLAFRAYPPATGGPDLGTIVVAAVDAGGNTVDTSTDTVVLSISPGADTFACTGGLSQPLTGGLATFDGCSEAVAGSGYVITATGSTLPAQAGAPFDVAVTGTRLVFCWSDGNLPCSSTSSQAAMGGIPFPLQPTILVEDAAGNVVTTDETTVVSLAMTGGSGGTLTCWDDLSMTVVDGIAWFDGCAIDRAGAYELTASAAPALDGASSSIPVTAGAPAELVLLAEPTAAQAGQAFAVQPVVAIADAGGNLVTGATATVALSLTSDTGTGSLTCSGGLTATTESGVASFSGCRIDRGGTGYIISVDQVDISESLFLFWTDSDPFDVAAGPAAVTLTSSAGTVTAGGVVTLTASLGAGGAGEQLRLEASADRTAWTRVATATVDDAGAASFQDRPTTNRWYRAVFDGTPDLLAATSPTIGVGVRPALGVRPGPTARPRTVGRGVPVTFVVTVRPAGSARTRVAFAVYSFRKGAWTKVATRSVLTNATGTARLTYRFPTAGRWYVRALAVATATNAASAWSPVLRYDVR